jgi:CheY-like chemotaxis protein
MKKAFEPYFTTKEKGDGTGLGLALVQAIVEEHDGFLNLHSKVDKGTSFYLYFPVVREHKNHHQQKNQLTHVQNGREKVMFVDDESYIRESTKDFLEKYGYQVAIFQNGRDALDTFKSNPSAFDIIITDMTMPEFTGAQLAKEILTMTPDMPIVLCTGFSENISPAEALEIGFRKYIQKPFRHQDIAALIRRILDKKR